MESLARTTQSRPFAVAYAWCGFAVMCAFWVSFVIFLAEPHQVLAWWPLPTIDRPRSVEHPAIAGLIDLALLSLFGLQHSIMARPWFKQRVMRRTPSGVERPTYVHSANLALFVLILFWRPIPVQFWNFEGTPAEDILWTLLRR
jgi:hypothetical protein